MRENDRERQRRREREGERDARHLYVLAHGGGIMSVSGSRSAFCHMTRSDMRVFRHLSSLPWLGPCFALTRMGRAVLCCVACMVGLQISTSPTQAAAGMMLEIECRRPGEVVRRLSGKNKKVEEVEGGGMCATFGCRALEA